METFKYYKVDKANQIPQIDEVEVFDYAEVDNKKVVGVLAENHLLFEDAVDAIEQTYDEVEVILLNCHLNKQLNCEISSRIKEKYSLDDEIALLHNKDSQGFIDYENFRNSIKAEVSIKKTAYGIKGA